MQKQWNALQSPEVNHLLAQLNRCGYEAYLVGGAVRNAMLELPIKDYDVATSATPEQLTQAFERVIPTGIKHGTVTVLIGNISIEVTTFRSEGTYSDGRRPDHVTFGTSIEQDLARRDFTINAMAIDRDGRLIDPYGGAEALKNRQLVAVGNAAKRLGEDRLRKLRAFRFVSQLGFTLCPQLTESLGLDPTLNGVSGERIKSEMDKILMGAHAVQALQSMAEIGVMAIAMPELQELVGYHQGHPAHRYDAFNHTLSVLEAMPQALARMQLKEGEEPDLLLLKWAALYHDTGKPSTRTIDEEGISHYYDHQIQSLTCFETLAKRLKFSQREMQGALALIELHMLRPVAESKPIRRWMNRVVSAFNWEGEVIAVSAMLTFLLADAIGTGTLQNYAYHDRLKELVREQFDAKVPMGRKALKIDGHVLMEAHDKLRREPKCLKPLFEALVDHCLEHPNDNEIEKLLAFSTTWIEREC